MTPSKRRVNALKSTRSTLVSLLIEVAYIAATSIEWKGALPLMVVKTHH